VTLTTRIATSADAAAVLELLLELSPDLQGLGLESVAERIEDDRVCVVLAHLDDNPVAMATLTMLVNLPDGIVGRVADVIVTEAARGHGAGKAVMLALHDEARRLRVNKLELSSRATREAANRLYQSLGYDQRETNVYRIQLD
jgi:GNAT superfamily N-acetyltransferase